MSFLSTIAGFAGDALSGLASAGANIWSTVYQNKANRAEAAANRGFQQEMSSTSHQREVADLKAAGLNPLLSGTGGSGSSTPSGSVAHIESPVKLDPMMILGVQKARADVSKTKAETAVQYESAKNLQEQNKNLGVQNLVLQRQAEKMLVDMGYTRVQAAKIIAEGHGGETIEGQLGTGTLTNMFVKGNIQGKSYIPSMTVENAMSRLPADFYDKK